jgi:hypothetical protein
MNSQDIKDVLEVSRILGGYSVDINEADTVAALIDWKASGGQDTNTTPAPKAAAPEPAPEPAPVAKTRTKRQPATAASDSDTDF